MKKPKTLWLGRSINHGDYEIGNQKDWNEYYGFDKDYAAIFLSKDFERLTGIKLRKGELRRITTLMKLAKK